MLERTITEALVERLMDAGVRLIYGVPGGECNLDFIAATTKLGARFVLTRNETAAARPGPRVVIATPGVPVSSAVTQAMIAAAVSLRVSTNRAPSLVVAAMKSRLHSPPGTP